MIHIDQFQEVFGRPELKVVSPTGDYNEADLLECAGADDLGRPLCMFQAQCIVFGDVVYQQDEVLSEAQVAELLAGTATEDVIGNEDMIDDTAPVVTPRTVPADAAGSPAASPAVSEPPTPEADSVVPVDTVVPTIGTEESVVPEEVTGPVTRSRGGRSIAARKRSIG